NRFADARTLLQRLAEPGGPRVAGSPMLQAIAGLFLAMTQHRLGERDAARQTLGDARPRFERAYPTVGCAQIDHHFVRTEWVRLQIFRREAEALIGAK